MEILSNQSILPVLSLLLVGFGGVMSGLLLWGIKALISAMFKNTMELAMLNSKIEQIMDETKAIPKIQKDLNSLIQWKMEFQTNKG